MNETTDLKPTITSIPYNERAQAHQEALGLIGKPTLPGSPISQPDANTPTPLPTFNVGQPDGKGGVWMCAPKGTVQPQIQVAPNNPPQAPIDWIKHIHDTQNVKRVLDDLHTAIKAVSQAFPTQERVNAINYMNNASQWLDQDIQKLSAKMPKV